ncbi:biotin/lipoyl-containing protein [Cobetia sp. 5-25-4-2]|uniref:acetyl-CoA carboxylase biotin carboxyl carrier protein n=1 Tax=Cobetia sp. 5-25-4-2 TaxID=2737459 RepID=UPI00210041CF|nr:biotin/lipoyl-containing protein [Cobetia sp. 5-25-4-2]
MQCSSALPRTATTPSVVALYSATHVEAGPHVVKSPGVGWVRLSHPLMEGSLARLGEAVGANDIVALIQVGPLMLPVHASSDGTITVLLVNEGDTVDFDAPLLHLQSSPPA